MKSGIFGLVIGASIIAILVLFFQRGDQKAIAIKNEKTMIGIQQGQSRSLQRMEKTRLDNADNEIDKAYHATQIDLEQKRIDDLEKRKVDLDKKETLVKEQQEEDYVDFRNAVEAKGEMELKAAKLDAEKAEFLKDF